MVKHHKNKAVRRLLVVSALAAGVAGVAYADSSDHTKILLKDPAGNQLTAGSTTAFSIKTTCFGTAGCHGDTSRSDNAKYTYNDIERHSYHATTGQSEFRGFNPANPDSTDAFRTAAGPKGKNWVQGPSHVGSW